MKNFSVLEKLRGKLIVSCQALETEPLYDPDRSLMGRMANAAYLGGASGIRANTVRDILEIKKFVNLPIIGIIKAETPGCDVYISPTIKEVDDLVAVGCDIIATDATDRQRPDGKSLYEFFEECKLKYPNQLFMADCSTYEECINADKMGFDVVSTTLTGYTEKSKGVQIPNFSLISSIVKDCKAYIIAEGGIWTPEQLAEAYKTGVDSVVIGSAITRPMEITKRFAAVLNK